MRSLLLLALIASIAFADDMAEKIKNQNSEVVRLAAKELSSQLPQKIDQFTQLLSIEGKEQTLLYTYKIDTGKKSDEDVIKEDKNRMKKAITNGICTSSKKFLESGIDITYIYTSMKSKKKLFRFDVSMKDCAKK